MYRFKKFLRWILTPTSLSITPSNMKRAAVVFSVTIIGMTVFLVSMAFRYDNKQTIPVAVTTNYVISDESIDISDRVITFDFEQPRQFILEGEPRMVSPQAIIDFSGDKVTYSGDLPVDEAAKVFFDVVMGFVREARECKP